MVLAKPESIMSHIDNYKENEEYAEFLASWDDSFFAKYVQSLAAGQPEKRILDVGCGVGQVVKLLRDQDHDAQGVDVSEPNIRTALKHVGHCQVYDGSRLPFEDATFDAVGAFNVLEHVDEPEAFIAELIRVLSPGGRLVISSPNFLRVLGFRDYHPRMRGLGSKCRNAIKLLRIYQSIRHAPKSVRFERMPPIVKEPFSPDDDAIVVTNALQMKFLVEQNGCRVQTVACTDRIVPGIVDWALNLPLLKYLWFNAFLVATKDLPQRARDEASGRNAQSPVG